MKTTLAVLLTCALLLPAFAASDDKGLFAGISLEGSTLRSDGSANEKLYKQQLSAKDIIRGSKVKAPPAAHDLIALLDKKTPKEQIRSQVATAEIAITPTTTSR